MRRLLMRRRVTGRYTKAIEQLRSKELDVRIRGIYALQRVARNSAQDHPTVMEVLATFIRERSREPWPLRDSGDREQERSTRPDVQAAINVILRRDPERDIRSIDLRRANLPRANLTDADLPGANLHRANLTGANLIRAHLRHADLTDADLPGANLTGANLTDVKLTVADLTVADLTGANLTGANLTDADLTDADLHRAHLTGADLRRANLTDANLTDADLRRANLTGARWPVVEPVPEGWKRDTSSGRVKRADADAGPTGTN